MPDGMMAPRILYSNVSPPGLRRSGGDCACAREYPFAPSTRSALGLYDCDCGPFSGEAVSYDCDCGLFVDGSISYDCDCGLFHDGSVSYDCDCGLLLDGRLSYDCDCGLVLDRSPAPAVPPASVPWKKQRLPVPVSLEGGWQATFNPAGPVGVTAINKEAQQVLGAFESPISPAQAAECLPAMPSVMAHQAMYSLARAGLLRPVAAATPRPPTRPTMLSAWLHVTQACTLSCPYCYVQKRPRAMSLAVGRRAVDTLVETAIRHRYGALKLKYAGGEPTLNFPLIRDLHARATRRAAQAGLALEGVVLSNGVGVTATMLDYLAREGLRLMVSLDGGPAAHDRVRAGRDGKSTYAAVAGTVERALERGLRPNISITLTALTLDSAGEAVAFALERGLPFNLNFYRECRSLESDPSPLVPDTNRLIDGVLEIFDLIRTLPAYPLPLGGILDRTRLDIPHDHVCSAGRHYLAVDTEGQVSACQMLLEEPWASLADMDPLDRIRQRGEPLFGTQAEGPGCAECQWRKACAGGCPLLRETVLHSRYCQATRALLPELVRLEAGRLVAAYQAHSSFYN